MAGRLIKPHYKVRTGCAQCKSRRVKCDELKPRCSRCLRYSETCTYQSTHAAFEHNTTPSPSDLSATTEQPDELLPTTTDLSLQDLELLHHWTVSSYRGFGESQDAEVLWRDDMPRLALQHPFLMRGILALSALHLARVDINRKDHYLSLASHHQTHALATYRYLLSDLSARMTHENSRAIFTLGHLTIAYAFASPHLPGNVVFAGLGSDSGVPEWLALLRGCRRTMLTVIGTSWESAFGFRRLDILSEAIDSSLNPEDKHLALISERLESTPSSIVIGGSEELQACKDALGLLRKAMSMPYQVKPTIGMKYSIFQWVENVEQIYLDYLGELRPLALVVLAYMCVGLKMCEVYWYIEDSAERILREINGILGQEWRDWITWPLEVIGAQKM